MSADELLSKLDRVRVHGTNKWSARCPAHADRSPSLSIRVAEDGRILVHCFAGCSVHEICGMLGLSVGELFSDVPRKGRGGARRRQQPWCFNWERAAFEFKFYADGLWLRSEAVLDAAKNLAIDDWTEHELEQAMNAVAKAYADRERGDVLEEVAFRIRERGLNMEKRSHAV